MLSTEEPLVRMYVQPRLSCSRQNRACRGSGVIAAPPCCDKVFVCLAGWLCEWCLCLETSVGTVPHSGVLICHGAGFLNLQCTKRCTLYSGNFKKCNDPDLVLWRFWFRRPGGILASVIFETSKFLRLTRSGTQHHKGLHVDNLKDSLTNSNQAKTLK